MMPALSGAMRLMVRVVLGSWGGVSMGVI
jgi:hypothetical protein